MSENEMNEPRTPDEPWRPEAPATPVAPAAPAWRPPADAAAGPPPATPSSGPAYQPPYPAPAGAPSYPAGAAYSYPPGAPDYATASYPQAGPGMPGTGPVTGTPYGPMQPQHRQRGGAGRKLAAGGLLVALMLGSAVGGAAIAHYAFDDNPQTRVVNGVVVAGTTMDRSSLATIAAAVRPSVVSITTGNAEGSGVILSDDGYILTNNHVAVTAQGKTVDVTFDDGTTVKASLVGTDPKTDLAVFKASSLPKKLTPAKFGDSGALRVGDTVLAIGSPLGLQGSVSEGIVSALNRTIDESADAQPQDPFSQSTQNSSPATTIAGAIQTDAAINPGNSGGALVNMNGEVVGINTAIATSSNGSDGNIGVGFAIPANRAKEVADDLIKGVAVSHPYLGIGVVTADGNGGALVKSVEAGSPAAKAGVQVGDIVTGFNGTAVHTSEDLVNDVQAGKASTSVALSVTRNGSNTTISVTLGESK